MESEPKTGIRFIHFLMLLWREYNIFQSIRKVLFLYSVNTVKSIFFQIS